MKEIFRMWKLVRIFYENRRIWANQLIEKDTISEGRKAILKQFSGRGSEVADYEIEKAVKEQEEIKDWRIHRAVINYNQEARAERKALVNAYIFTYHKEFNAEERGSIGFKDINDKNLRQKMVEIQSIIQSCIDEEHGFIKEDSQDKSRIYLTGKGKKFSSIDGLLKEEIINGLGVLWSVITTAMLAVGAIKWKVVWDAITQIFS